MHSRPRQARREPWQKCPGESTLSAVSTPPCGAFLKGALRLALRLMLANLSQHMALLGISSLQIRPAWVKRLLLVQFKGMSRNSNHCETLLRLEVITLVS